MNWMSYIKELDPLVPWLNLASSLFLAIITLWYVAITAKTLRQAQTVEDDRQRRARREQAAAIAAWVRKSEVDGDRASVEIVVRNPTSQPIYALQLSLYDTSGGSLPATIHTPQLLGPDEERCLEVRSPIPDNASGDLRLALGFVDSSGSTWIRGADGSLTEKTSSTVTRAPKSK